MEDLASDELLTSRDGMCSTKYVGLGTNPQRNPSLYYYSRLRAAWHADISGDGSGHSAQDHEEIIRVHYASNES